AVTSEVPPCSSLARKWMLLPLTVPSNLSPAKSPETLSPCCISSIRQSSGVPLMSMVTVHRPERLFAVLCAAGVCADINLTVNDKLNNNVAANKHRANLRIPPPARLRVRATNLSEYCQSESV